MADLISLFVHPGTLICAGVVFAGWWGSVNPIAQINDIRSELRRIRRQLHRSNTQPIIPDRPVNLTPITHSVHSHIIPIPERIAPYAAAHNNHHQE